MNELRGNQEALPIEVPSGKPAARAQTPPPDGIAILGTRWAAITGIGLLGAGAFLIIVFAATLFISPACSESSGAASCLQPPLSRGSSFSILIGMAGYSLCFLGAILRFGKLVDGRIALHWPR